ncbi:MAG: hypothetical protein ACUVRO_04190 [Armatimonadota bacterium]
MRLDFGPLLLSLKSPELIQILQQVEHWSFNNVDDLNIRQGGITGSLALKDWSVPLKKLAWREVPVPLCKPIPAVSTTESVDGGYFLYDPNRFPGGSWYLEACLKVTSGGTATFELKRGANAVGSVSTQNTDWTVVRSSAALSMPSSLATLTGTLRSNSTGYTAYCLGASLIFVPT